MSDDLIRCERCAAVALNERVMVKRPLPGWRSSLQWSDPVTYIYLCPGCWKAILDLAQAMPIEVTRGLLR